MNIKNKLWLLLGSIIFGLAFFTSLRIIAIYYYHLHSAKGNYTLTMNLMDKAGTLDLGSYISGGLHFSVVIVIIMIILDR